MVPKRPTKIRPAVAVRRWSWGTAAISANAEPVQVFGVFGPLVMRAWAREAILRIPYQ